MASSHSIHDGYGAMHRIANEVFMCIREGFAYACSRKCRKADVMFTLCIVPYTKTRKFCGTIPLWFQ